MTTRNQPILLVEDSDEDFEVAARAFRKARIANPLCRCSTGDEALDFLFRRGDHLNAPRPGIILLDLNLPGTDGREVLEEIKSDPGLKTIPVIVLTTSGSDYDIHRCYELGANSFIRKPVSFDGFLHAVERLRDYWLEVAILPRGKEGAR